MDNLDHACRIYDKFFAKNFSLQFIYLFKKIFIALLEQLFQKKLLSVG